METARASGSCGAVNAGPFTARPISTKWSSAASPIGPRTSPGKMTAACDRPAAFRKVGSSIRVAAGGTCSCADAVDFDQHAVDVDLDCGNREEFPGPHRGHRENSDRGRSCRTRIVGADATSEKPAVGSAPAQFAGSLIPDPAGHYSTGDFFLAPIPADRIGNAAQPATFTTKSTGGKMTRPRAADDFPAIRARLGELRRERVQASAGAATQPLPQLPDHAAPGRFDDTGRHRLLRAIRQKIHR